MRRSVPLSIVALAAASLCVVTAISPVQAVPSVTRPPAPTATPAVPLQGTLVTLSARFPTRFKRPAALQINAGSGWHRVAAKRTQRNGRVTFSVTVPGDVWYRVRARAVRHHGHRRPALVTKARRVRATLRAELVSGTPQGTSTGKESGFARLSGDGRYVVFHSDATTLEPGVTGYLPNMTHVFLRDRVTRTTVLIDRASSTVASNGTSARPAISQDGRFVTFASTADNLVTGDGNAKQDIFRWDRTTGDIIRVSEAGAGGSADDNSYDPVISGDGSRIAYSSNATTIDADDDNGLSDIYVWDAGTDESDRISENLTAGDANGGSFAASISANGGFVAYHSAASDLVFNDTNGAADVFRRNLSTDTNLRVSTATSGQPNGYSTQATISATGRYVAFASQADNLVPGGSPDNGTTNVFVRDLIAGTAVLVSHDRVSGPTNGISYGGSSISDDGRLVTFPSLASDLVAGDTNSASDAFLWDRSTGKVSMIVRDKLWGPTNGSSFEPVLSADGRWVAFYSVASDLVPADTTAVTDAFVWRR